MFPRAAAFSIPPRTDSGLPWRVALLLCLSALLLNACGSAPKPQTGGAGNRGAAVSGAHQSGGSYKIGKPYKVAGKWYHPRAEPDYDRVGVASWYGHPFHGRRTANGEVYDMEAMTAAHTTLPLPSYVEVTNLDNGRATVLRVNDRGPFVAGRIIDVSRRAAQELGFYNQGTARVRVRVIGAPPSDPIMVAAAQPVPPQRRAAAPARASARAAAPATTAAAPVAAVAAAPVIAAPLPPPAASARALPPAPAPEEAPPVVAAPPVTAPVAAPVAASAPVVLANAAPALYIQAGAFADAANAERLRLSLVALGPAEVSPAQVSGRAFHRVRIGPLASAAEASRTLARLQALGHAEARLVMERPAGARSSGADWAGGAVRRAGLP